LSYFFSAPENHAFHRIITKKYGQSSTGDTEQCFLKEKNILPLLGIKA
jgi:hypothetical protein